MWDITYGNLRNGNWCPNCHSLSRFLTKEEKLEGFNSISKIAKEKGGKCLSEINDYKNITSRLKFQCAKKHEWETKAACIKMNRWCQICCQSLSEKIFRKILETIFNRLFPNCYPKWLKNNKNHQLQIDGYNEGLKFGFEYQGKQHFKFSSHFHKTKENFERRKLNDKIKKKILKYRDIFMIYPTYKLSKENYFDYIKSQIINTKYEELANFNQKVDINDMYKII